MSRKQSMMLEKIFYLNIRLPNLLPKSESSCPQIWHSRRENDDSRGENGGSRGENGRSRGGCGGPWGENGGPRRENGRSRREYLKFGNYVFY